MVMVWVQQDWKVEDISLLTEECESLYLQQETLSDGETVVCRITSKGDHVFTRHDNPWQKYEPLKLGYYYRIFQEGMVRNLLQAKKPDLGKMRTRPAIICEPFRFRM